MSDKLVSWSELKGYLISVGLASAILFGYGKHPTVDAIIVTAVWIFLVIAALTFIAMTAITIAIRRPDNRYDKDLGKFYKALSSLHKSTLKRLLGFVIVGYWLYALVVQEWTATAVLYVILTIYGQFFIYATKDLAKDFFVNQLKGNGTNEA